MTLRYPRPTSLGRLGPGHNVVESSAGTGKTFLLEHLFVDLILSHGIAADQILVVTFTEKAAAELVLRVRGLLVKLANLRQDHPQVAEAADLAEDACWLIDERARQRLHEANLAFPRASISTIHAFCQRVLREHAFAQGRLFDEELVDGKTVFHEALYEVLRSQGASEPRLHALLKAWLGGGKNVADLAKLLWSCAEKDAEVLRPEFDETRLTRALTAWQSFKPDDHLVQSLKNAGIHWRTSEKVVKHLNTFANNLSLSAGDPFLTLARCDAEDDHWLAYLAGGVVEKKPSPVVAALARKLRELQDAWVPFRAVAAQLLLPVVQTRAAARKRGAGHYDYDDMLGLLAEALADPGPAGRDLLAALRGHYRHGLIDEFQDTDRTQWQIFRRIFVEAGDGGHGLTVVGDPKQAIYGFRSADVRTYLEASRTLVSAGARRLALRVNYRSTAPLIDAGNLLFALPGFFQPGSGISYDQPVDCGRPERTLASSASQPEPPVMLLRLANAPDPIKAEHARRLTAAAIVEEIRRLTAPGSPIELRDGEQTRPVTLRDIFVLTFTNNESQAIGRVLGRAGIRYSFYKLGNLFESAEAYELRDLLLALCAPEDRDRRAKALLTRFFGLDLPALALLQDSTGQSEPARILLELAELSGRVDVPTLFAALVERTGVIRRELWQGGSERGLTNIVHLLELLQAEWARSNASLPELALLLDAYVSGTAEPPGHESDLQRLETDENAVQILTIHKAKGLEADVVFLFGGLSASRRENVYLFHEAPGDRRALYVGTPDSTIKSRVEQEGEDEQSRLHYVALTRARYRLYLPHYPPQLKRLDGSYRRINRWLDQLDDIPSSERERLFGSRAVDCTTALAEPSDAGDPTGRAIPPDVLATPAEPPDLAELRRKRAGFLVTSYSAVKRLRRGLDPSDERAAITHDAIQPPDPERLPGGAETGIFLHEILAEVPLAGLSGSPDFPAWREGVAPLLDRLCRRHHRPAAHAEQAARLVYAAYTTPVRLAEDLLPNLASVESALREMEFLYPMPERRHPLLSHPGSPAGDRLWRIDRGVVKGYIDLLFAHAGRIYVCDWKSDDLASYDVTALAQHCAQSYDVQARIYTLAALRMFGIAQPDDYAARFGGVVFCFLRARTEGDDRHGIFFRQPTWEEILDWEHAMEGQAFWGLA